VSKQCWGALHPTHDYGLPANTHMFCYACGRISIQEVLKRNVYATISCDQAPLEQAITPVDGTLLEAFVRLSKVAELCGVKPPYDLEDPLVSARYCDDMAKALDSKLALVRGTPREKVVCYGSDFATRLEDWITRHTKLGQAASSVVIADNADLILAMADLRAAELYARDVTGPMPVPEPSRWVKNRTAAQAAYDAALAEDGRVGTDATFEAVGVAHKALETARAQPR
jgi:hypothetical protein